MYSFLKRVSLADKIIYIVRRIGVPDSNPDCEFQIVGDFQFVPQHVGIEHKGDRGYGREAVLKRRESSPLAMT